MARTFVSDKMRVSVYDSNDTMGAAAARDLAALLRDGAASGDDVSIILATGNSQLSFMAALRARPDIPWDKMTVFHMDEYIGMSAQHPASFRRYLREKLVDVVHPRAFHGLAGDAPDRGAEIARYTALLQQHRPIACVLGMGENGHLAFNDPPADFQTRQLLAVVTLDEVCRRQQVGEGHFAAMDDVPRQAITLTVPALLAPPRVLAIVPETRKARAVQQALEGPVTPECPASILRTNPHVHLYLDQDAAALLRV